MANHSSILVKNSMNSMKKQKDMTSDDDHTRLAGVQYATGEKGTAITDNSRKNEVPGPKWKRCAVVDMSDGESLML